MGIRYYQYLSSLFILVDFFFVINIGNVMMFGMGKLAIDLNLTVGAVFGMKNSCFFCQNRSHNCKKWAIRIVFIVFFMLSIVYVVLSALVVN